MARKAIYILIGLLAVAVLVSLTPSPAVCSWDFQHCIWGPAWLLVSGQPPYQFDAPYGPYLAVWWPQIIGALFWMGWLPCWPAAKLWLLVEICGLALSVWLLNCRKKPAPWQLGVILLAVFFFAPVYYHIELGQFSLLFLAMMVMVVFLPGDGFPPRRLPWWLPLLLALGAAKPQLTVLVYPGVLAATLRRQGWYGVGRLALASAGWLAVCLVPLFIFYPGWVTGFLNVTNYNLNLQWNLPTLYLRLALTLGRTGQLIWLALFLSALALVLWLWLKKGARAGLIWSLGLTPMVTPYASSWDFTLLLPAFIWLLLKMRSRRARFALGCGMLLVDLGMVASRWGKSELPDASQWWIPPALLATYLLAMLVERREASRAGAAAAESVQTG
jgi:hypothetical protein